MSLGSPFPDLSWGAPLNPDLIQGMCYMIGPGLSSGTREGLGSQGPPRLRDTAWDTANAVLGRRFVAGPPSWPEVTPGSPIRVNP